MTRYPRQALVADVGATSLRIAISDLDELTISNYALFRSELFESPLEAIKAYLKTTPERPDHVGIAVAGPVTQEHAALTNRPWAFTAEDIRDITGGTHVHLLNDFEAMALSLPHLTRDEIVPIGGGTALVGAPMAVLGPGTGLGVAGLIDHGGTAVAIPGEGGHVSFAVESHEEFAILESLRAGQPHFSAEQILSGPGLMALYRILAGKTAEGIAAPEIVERATKRSDPAAEEAMDYFARWLGRFAGDVALMFGARGGVYLGGGIPPRIVDFLDTGAFRAAFEAKGRVSEYVAPIPTYVIRSQNAGLQGAAISLANTITAR